MKFRISLSTIFNVIVLFLVFPISVSAALSIKFWVVVALLAGAVTAAEFNGAERAKKGEL